MKDWIDEIINIFTNFFILNNCSNQNFGSFLKKKNDDIVQKPNLDIDKNISFEDFKNKNWQKGKISIYTTSFTNV